MPIYTDEIPFSPALPGCSININTLKKLKPLDIYIFIQTFTAFP